MSCQKRLFHLQKIASLSQVKNNPALYYYTSHEIDLCKSEIKEREEMKKKNLKKEQLYSNYPYFTKDLEALRVGQNPWKIF